MKTSIHDASARQHPGEASSGLGPNGGRKDRLHNQDLAEVDGEIARLVDRSTPELRRAWRTLHHTGPPPGLSRDLAVAGADQPNRPVSEDGFEYDGQHYRSLTVIAEQITGAHWSGPRFFGVSKRARAS